MLLIGETSLAVHPPLCAVQRIAGYTILLSDRTILFCHSERSDHTVSPLGRISRRTKTTSIGKTCLAVHLP